MPEVQYDKFTVIVIAVVQGKTVGLLVDAISDVLQVDHESMRPTPDFGAAVDTRFITGVFQSKEQLIVVLDLEKLLTDNETRVAEADLVPLAG